MSGMGGSEFLLLCVIGLLILGPERLPAVARKLGGFAIGLEGSFRESYASFTQITQRVLETFQKRFGDDWEQELSCAALYPGYGPLAENAAAIRQAIGIREGKEKAEFIELPFTVK